MKIWQLVLIAGMSSMAASPLPSLAQDTGQYRHMNPDASQGVDPRNNTYDHHDNVTNNNDRGDWHGANQADHRDNRDWHGNNQDWHGNNQNGHGDNHDWHHDNHDWHGDHGDMQRRRDHWQDHRRQCWLRWQHHHRVRMCR